jgi:ATP-dependent DNA ligase
MFRHSCFYYTKSQNLLLNGGLSFFVEGIVTKRKDAPSFSGERNTAWVKFKNRQYSQIQDRDVLFSLGERRKQGKDGNTASE